METKELLEFEVNKFKNDLKGKIKGGLNDENIKKCFNYALNDAINQGARRNSISYLDAKETIFNEFCKDYLKVGKKNKVFNNEGEYQKYFIDLVKKYEKVMSENGLEKLAGFGFAQKFLNMSFKYLYCIDGCDRDNLRFCYLPLDRFTIAWCKEYCEKDIMNEFKKINYAWSNIDSELFFKIQSDVAAKLKTVDYPINCKDKRQTIRLNVSRLEAEFIIWRQEQLNEFFKALEKNKNFYDRLGIKEK